MGASLERAITLRENGKAEEAIAMLGELLREFSSDADVNYQMAWAFDSLGRESEAAPFYEQALALGLRDDRAGAFLGLGSTYRCLGEYEKSLGVFDRAILEFPDDNALKVFRALTLFNLGRAEESVRELLVQLLNTTRDPLIQSYDRALRFYSGQLK